jgi:hypothetical protein
MQCAVLEQWEATNVPETANLNPLRKLHGYGEKCKCQSIIVPSVPRKISRHVHHITAAYRFVNIEQSLKRYSAMWDFQTKP